MHDLSENELKERVVRENLDYLVRFALFRIGNMSLAEDTVYDAIVKFIEHRHPPIAPENMRSYLFRIVYNLCQERCRVASKYNVPLEQINEVSLTPEQQLDSDEVERINSILDALPERQAEVIRMNVIDELSFAEISRILSVPESTLKSRFKTGMNKLKDLYLKDE